MNTSFFGEMLQSITERGRALLDRRATAAAVATQRSESLVELCEELLSGRGEASGVALAGEILAEYAELTIGPRIAFFEALATRSAPTARGSTPRSPPGAPTRPTKTAAEVHRAAEPRRQELLRRLNLAPGGTAALVRMREQLLDALDHRDDLAAVDARLRPSVLVLVQPRLPGAAPDRLVDAGDDPGKDHPLRGGAPASAAGTICAAASIRRTGAATPSSIRRWSTSR